MRERSPSCWIATKGFDRNASKANAADLEELFAELAANISKPGATDIVIDEVVNPDFVITSILSPTKGTTTMLDAHSLRWDISELGVTSSESASLDFFIRHVSQQSGTKLVNQSITYSDREGNLVSFPKPAVTVECDIVVHPEECPEPVELSVEGCQDSVLVDLGDVYLESQGRIIQMDVTIKNVCPGKRVALAAILTEVDQNDMEYQRGMKAVTIPPHSAPACRDVLAKCIKFVVPEDLNVSGGAMCGPRRFKARFLANNVDTDYRCCESVITIA